MGSSRNISERRNELEARVLASALRQSFELGDTAGALLAHRQLTALLRQSIVPQKSQQRPKTTDLDIGLPSGSSPLPPVEGTSPNKLTFYNILGSDPMSSFEDIHLAFLKLVRKLIHQHVLYKSIATREFRQNLQTLSVAHDILRDPVTRTDYDFRLLGLRGHSPMSTLEETRTAGLANKTPLRIGELLQCAQILEPQELEIVVDMHKAMPELYFGQFLVKQGFLSEDELASALLGQRLIVAGKLTVAQFQLAMQLVRKNTIPLGETLLQNGWVQSKDLLSPESTQDTTVLKSTKPPEPVCLQSKEVDNSFLERDPVVQSLEEQLTRAMFHSSSPQEEDKASPKAQESGESADFDNDME